MPSGAGPPGQLNLWPVLSQLVGMSEPQRRRVLRPQREVGFDTGDIGQNDMFVRRSLDKELDRLGALELNAEVGANRRGDSSNFRFRAPDSAIPKVFTGIFALFELLPVLRNPVRGRPPGKSL
jgi:hypothetical protein